MLHVIICMLYVYVKVKSQQPVPNRSLGTFTCLWLTVLKTIKFQRQSHIYLIRCVSTTTLYFSVGKSFMIDHFCEPNSWTPGLLWLALWGWNQLKKKRHITLWIELILCWLKTRFPEFDIIWYNIWWSAIIFKRSSHTKIRSNFDWYND